MRKYLLLLFVVVLILASGCFKAGKKYEFIEMYEQDGGVVIGIHGGVSKYALWPSTWDKDQSFAAEHGGMKVFMHMHETGDDWMGIHLFVPKGDTLVIDVLTRVCLSMQAAGITDTLESKEIVLTDDPGQRQMFSNSCRTIRLTEAVSAYHRAQNGAWVAFVRFGQGTLDLDHDKGIEAAGMPVPLECMMIFDMGR